MVGLPAILLDHLHSVGCVVTWLWDLRRVGPVRCSWRLEVCLSMASCAQALPKPQERLNHFLSHLQMVTPSFGTLQAGSAA
jgi:hypothetical protein